MKKLLLFLLGIVPLSTLAQNQRIDIGLSYGGYTSPFFQKNQPRDYVSADVGYHLTNRWAISVGYMRGQFEYYNDLPAIPTGLIYSQFIYVLDNPNARGIEQHGYALLKYTLIATPRFFLQLGTGVGYSTRRLPFTYKNVNYENSFSNVEFPLSVEGTLTIGKRVGLGIKAGGFVEANFPPVGLHIGPQLRLKL